MRTKTGLLMATLLAFVLAARAGEEQATHEASTSTSADSALKWNTDPNYWQKVLRSPRDDAGIQIGKSDYAVSGPLVDGIRKKRYSGERSLGQRLLSLPIIRLFVPRPMPNPPGGGKYFLWGESDRPWSTVAAGGAAASGNPAVTHEAASLISVSH